MAEKNELKERTILLPLDILERLNGFACDFGGSAIKVAYLCKEDWVGGKCEGVESGKGKLRLALFAREDLDACLQYLKESCFIKRDPADQERPLMYTCGIGGYQYGATIQEKLDVRIQNDNEMDCFKNTLQYYINNFPLEEFCVEPLEEVKEQVRLQMRSMWTQIQSIVQDDLMDDNTAVKEGVMELITAQHASNTNIKPYVLAMFGSAWACMQCGEDGKFRSAGFSQFAGRSFLGLGRLLTGAETYEELMCLAEKGDNLNLDITMKDLGKQPAPSDKSTGEKEEDQSDVYGRMRNLIPRPIFLWGKAFSENTQLGDFSKEDLARTLLYTMCKELVNTCLHSMHMTRTHHVFVAGSFIAHPLTQRIVTEEFEFLKLQGATYFPGIDGDYHLHILEFGSHFGALGAFMNGPQKTERRKRIEERKQEKDEKQDKQSETTEK